MSYYANGGGALCLKTTIPDEIGEKLSDIFDDVGDSPDDGLWLTFEYNDYDDDTMRDAMEMVAPYAKSGSVEFSGEDGEKWRFYFYDGKVRYENGRTVYEPENKAEYQDNRLELIGTLIDAVEDWLESKGITSQDIQCDDRDDAIKQGCDPDSLAIIYGSDFDILSTSFEETLINSGLLEMERY